MEWQRVDDDAPAAWCGASLLSDDAGLSPMVQLLKVLETAGWPDGPTAQLRPEGALAADADVPPPDLPCFSFSHESALLREPWPSSLRLASGASVFTRPCIFGRACQGMSPNLPGHAESGGVVLAEAMTPQELVEFEEHGRHPATRRACVLCSRFVTLDAYMFVNKMRSAPPNVLLNWYTNPTNCEDGYAAEKCIPLEGADTWWTGVFGRVALLSTASLRLRHDPATKRWFVDQSALAWRPDF